MSNFYEKYEKLCIQKGVSPSRAAQDVGLSNAAASGWSDGNKPRRTTIRKLADYFGVSVDYFEGTEPKKENPGIPKDTEVDPIRAELLNLIEDATEEQCQDYLDMLRIVLNRREKR